MSGKKVKKEDLIEWLSPNGTNFLGSGMTMREFYMADGIRRFQQSFGEQERKEQKRRQHFIFEMVLEARKVQEAHGTFLEGTWYVASGICFDMAIEALLEGDKKRLSEAADMCSVDGFSWNYGPEQGPAWGEIFAPFHKLCRDCVDSWPTGEEPIQA